MEQKQREVLYLASRNIHKLQELKTILGDRFLVRLCTELDADISWEETGETFYENALIQQP